MTWKIALTTVLLFTFVALPAIGQEMDIPSLKRLDLLAWSSDVMMSKNDTPHIEDHEVEIAEETGEFSELKLGLQKTEEPSPHSIAGEPEHSPEQTGFLHFLRKVFSSAMSF